MIWLSRGSGTEKVCAAAWSLRSPLDKLLAAVDVEGRPGDRRVRHEVDGQCGDVGRADDAGGAYPFNLSGAARILVDEADALNAAEVLVVPKDQGRDQ